MSLNPFNLPGPEFLLFFLALAALVIGLVYLNRPQGEPSLSPGHDLANDKFEIAYLQGGPGHTLQVALLGLIDRKLLTVQGTKVKTVDPSGADKVRWNLEKVILRKCKRLEETASLFSDADVQEEVEIIGDRLRQMGLLLNDEQKSLQKRHRHWAILFLWGVAVIKIFVALSRRHFNILFLFILIVIATILVIMITRMVRTALGEQKLKELRAVFSSLYARRKQIPLHGFTHELTLLAALYGLAVLPTPALQMIKPLRFHQTSTSGCSGGCSIGASCAGASSCSGGSCGGGCGGGCGGCG